MFNDKHNIPQAYYQGYIDALREVVARGAEFEFRRIRQGEDYDVFDVCNAISEDMQRKINEVKKNGR
jgi:hypothetical protein